MEVFTINKILKPTTIAISMATVMACAAISPVVLDGIGALVGMPTIRYQYRLLAVTILFFVLVNIFTI